MASMEEELRMQQRSKFLYREQTTFEIVSLTHDDLVEFDAIAADGFVIKKPLSPGLINEILHALRKSNVPQVETYWTSSEATRPLQFELRPNTSPGAVFPPSMAVKSESVTVATFVAELR